MKDRVLGAKEVSEVGRVRALLPKESDFIGKPGYRRKYRKDGSYEWRYRFRTNRGGKLTKEAAEVGEMLRPFQQADTARHEARERLAERARMRDADGSVRYVALSRAADTARRNGWRHDPQHGGLRIVAGPGGMLFRHLGAGRYEPLGVRCLGTPLVGSAKLSKDREWTDPTGRGWCWSDAGKRWEPVDD